DIELGELLCNSLDGAQGSTLLRFAFSSTETVTAERTSFSVIAGDVFTDGKDRKTFLLEMIAFNADGTTSVKTSVPCEAGSSNDICMMEVVLRQLEANRNPKRSRSRHDRTRSGSRNVRNQRQSPPYCIWKAIVEADEGIVPSRRLQSTTQIDVMFLYSSDALTRVVGGATAEQMETKIANELPKATEAAANSEIDLEFNLVHAGLLPYDQAGLGAASSGSELSTLRTNAAVKALRDTYAADLVVLVGSFSGTCGLG
ncbi:unnamed protein product, partial [Hapterophycus canaliculatus]